MGPLHDQGAKDVLTGNKGDLRGSVNSLLWSLLKHRNFHCHHVF